MKVMKQYYDHRAPEYDEWYLGAGRFAQRDRPGWEEDLKELEDDVTALAPARTLDVACGTGFLTRHLRGEVTALDQSERMLEVAARQVPDATLVSGDALVLPFADDSFHRLFTGHFYGHLEGSDRDAFLAEAHRVASELVIVDSARRPEHEPEERQERILNDGSRYEVYKRFFEPEALAQELGGGTVLHASRWFVMVSSRSPRG
jgi:demethylmenaquinone methyltransferase/2-methoxy-6-polyprenyl-1,4-benzoquinol methylase